MAIILNDNLEIRAGKPADKWYLSPTNAVWADVAVPGNIVQLGSPVPAANSMYTAFVSAANVVTVRLNNYSLAAIDPASGLFTVSVSQ